MRHVKAAAGRAAQQANQQVGGLRRIRRAATGPAAAPLEVDRARGTQACVGGLPEVLVDDRELGRRQGSSSRGRRLGACASSRRRRPIWCARRRLRPGAARDGPSPGSSSPPRLCRAVRGRESPRDRARRRSIETRRRNARGEGHVLREIAVDEPAGDVASLGLPPKRVACPRARACSRCMSSANAITCTMKRSAAVSRNRRTLGALPAPAAASP